MKIEAYVTTAPRPVDYLQRTLDSLTEAGFQSVHVVEDNIGSGISATYRKTLTEALAVPSDAILVCQDDILVAAGLAGWLETLEWPAENIGCVSLYCAGPHRKEQSGWWEQSLVPTDKLKQPWVKVYGALAMLWPRQSAEAFLAYNPHLLWKSKVDQLIGKWCMETGRRLFVHSPSLVEHIGAVSTFGGHSTLTPARMAGQWVHDVRGL